jgi:hypothetical protein
MTIFGYCYLTFVKGGRENFLPVAGGISEFFLNVVGESQQKKQVKTPNTILHAWNTICSNGFALILTVVIILPSAGRW